MKKLVGIALIAAFGLLFFIFFISKKTQEHALETSLDMSKDGSPPVQHLACIMDGNRRWAQKKGLKPWYGHKEGIEAVKKVIEFCYEKKIPYLTLYTFSLENFNRSADENSYLFTMMLQEAQKGVDEFRKYGVRARFIGDRNLFPAQLIPLLDSVEQQTADLSNVQVTFMFCYGARQEIAAAAKSIALHVKSGALSIDEITPELFSAYLLTSNIPDPDLIIRTGGYSRLSNFLLYQAAYSELCILDCLWPDITKEHLQKALDDYCSVKRNYGG
jgi:undecaprenyl diphosphate synthase